MSIIVSDEAIEFLDSLVELNAINRSHAATSAELTNALDYSEVEQVRRMLRELIGEGLVRKRPPTSIDDTVSYYVDMPTFNRYLIEIDPEFTKQEPEAAPVDWRQMEQEIASLETALDNSDLGQAARAQAGAVIASIKILIEAPDPPKKAIRALLLDLAAIATIFALAAQLAGLLL